MTVGLRERKKQQREQRILDAAVILFSRQGFAGATIDEIAERAEVGVGTVYNYFKSKNELLVAIVARDTDDIIKNGEKILNTPPKDPVKAFLSLFSSYMHDFCSYDKEILRELFSIVLTHSHSMVDEMMQQDMRLVEQIHKLLQIFDNKGLLSANAATLPAALVLYELFCMQLIMYISIQDTKMRDVEMMIEQKLGLIFHGFLK